MSFFLWRINIDYTGTIPQDQIMSGLRVAGLKVGEPMASINPAEIQNKMMTAFPDLVWIGISSEGTCAYVQIEDRRDVPEVEDLSVPCNIVATKPGVITKINTSFGLPDVKVGTAVATGQMLVSGVVESTEFGTRYLHATSDIQAQTLRTESMPAPTFREVTTQTGKTKTKDILDIFGFKIPLFFSDEVSFQDYDRVSAIKQAKIGNELFLPFILHYDKFYEVKKENVQLTSDEAIALAKTTLTDKMNGELSSGGQILNESLTTSKSDAGETIVTLQWDCLENIGQQIPISVTN